MSSDDDEATRIKPAGSHDSFALPIGTRLGEFELTHRVGEGGFGIVYLAYDHTLDRSVALKEYMPSSLAMRSGEKQISVRAERYRETFEAGMKSFINEAKLLARFDHPSLVKVYRFWQENGTAYMAMPFYNGVNLRDTVRGLPEPPDEEWLLDLLHWLTEALAVIHAESCYHRDIAPDNVMMLADTGRPLLLDFGAARRVIGDMTQALTVILKPGYAPVEQYAEAPGMKQGAWTDVYALAAVIYWTIAGKTPPPAVGRLLGDTCVPLVDLAAGRYSLPFLEAIDRALAVRPEQRTQDIHQLREELGLAPATVPAAASGVTSADAGSGVRTHTSAARPTTAGRAPTTGGRTPTTAGKVPTTTGRGPTTAGRATTAGEPRSTPATAPGARTTGPAVRTHAPEPAVAEAAPDVAPDSRRRLMLGLGAGVVALALGGGLGWWLYQRQGAAPPVVVVQDRPASAAASAPTPPASAPVKLPPPLPPALRDTPTSAERAFVQWREARDPALAVMLRASPSPKVAGPGALRLTVASQQPGTLYLVAARSDQNRLVLWHSKRVDAGVPLEIDAAALPAQALRAGNWRVMALVTRQPRELAALGWRSEGPLTTRSFDGAAPPASSSWWAAACAPGAASCDLTYGADDLQIEVAPESNNVIPPPASAAVASTPKPGRPPRPQDPPPGERRPDPKANAAECARLLQQMSLGDTSAEVSARYRALGCR